MGIGTEDWLQAQYGVLGAAMIDPKLVPVVLRQTSDTDYTGKCREVYQAMRMLFSAGQPADVVTIRDKLGAGITDFLVQLMEITPTTANLQTYIDVCKRQARDCKLREIGLAMADADDAEQLKSLLDQANMLMVDTKQQDRCVGLRETFRRFYERQQSQKNKEYLSWPIAALNEKLFVDHGNFVILGGYPSAGKTALSIQFAAHMLRKHRIGYFSFETSPDTLGDRLISHGAGIQMEHVKRRTMSKPDEERVYKLDAGTQDCVLDWYRAAGMSVADVQAITYAKRYDVVFLDYIQLIRPRRGCNRYEEITGVSIDLHTFAQNSGCYVIALSQLTRPDKTGASAAPTMSSLRESGQLEQDADVILMLYLEDAKAINGRRVLRCAKNKEGEQFKMLLDFDGATQTFTKATDFGGLQSEIKRASRQKPQQAQMEILPPDEPLPAGWENE